MLFSPFFFLQPASLIFFFTMCNIMNNWKQALILPDFSALMLLQWWFVHGKMLNFTATINHFVSQDQIKSKSNQSNQSKRYWAAVIFMKEHCMSKCCLYIMNFYHNNIKHIPIMSTSILIIEVFFIKNKKATAVQEQNFNTCIK